MNVFAFSGSTINAYSVMSQISDDLRAQISDLLIPPDQVHLEEMVGKGYFGNVYRGKLRDSRAVKYLEVAVKTMKGKDIKVFRLRLKW